ncbi:hypothetical protein D9623_34015 (plasmid) [Azospirillum brasilense]|uniref:Uncharacterized protein n=1 Tax=Azospirillum brasilense TaxID=192 RepID=A0A4D8QTR6_AZOBR|nr:hypothetical protein FE89_02180 [Azospirillum brasilense]PWC91816.1 hypothetical protein AEJ54_17765 [Azospirillum sp. Sp 7]OPH21659.1 hypothetical protein FE88_08280 [Azospirillum brasilense]QCO12921.1 hypothetical protein D3868_28345 [Azospirillum brasilense]QEL93963.1 hypothetical protein D9621_27910 [Azospirillum brasilense]
MEVSPYGLKAATSQSAAAAGVRRRRFRGIAVPQKKRGIGPARARDRRPDMRFGLWRMRRAVGRLKQASASAGLTSGPAMAFSVRSQTG